jgi:acetolactate synthase-1/2/3 large subunit
LANGLANLHNARRARSPIINIVGDHATNHLQYDAPLTSDVAGVARPMSAWVETSTSAENLASAGASALRAALEPPGQIATLIVPADHAWSPAVSAAPIFDRPTARKPSSERIDEAARLLRSPKRVALLLGSGALIESGLEAAGRIADATKAEILRETFTARVERGAGRVEAEALPYFGEAAAARLEKLEALVLIGAKAPVSFFAYPERPSWLAPSGCEMLSLAEPDEDPASALADLAAALDCEATTKRGENQSLPDAVQGELNPQSLAITIARCLPEGAIVSDESATAGFLLPSFTAQAAPHDWLQLTGGSIGQGSPVAIGAAVACPDRQVLCLHGDGGAMYTLQALWTQAREGLDITTVILANRSYAILNVEFSRVGLGDPGAKALDMLDLTRPTLDWVKLAEGMGVPAKKVTTAEALAAQLAVGFSEPGPRLIEAVL